MSPPPPPAAGLPECRLLGMRLCSLRAAEVLDHIFDELAQGRGGWLVTANLDFLRRYHHDPAARALYDAASLRVADGAPLTWACRLQGTPVPERVAGSTIIYALVERAARERRTVYLLGGTESASAGAARIFAQRHPGLDLCGRSTPMFSSPPAPEEIAHVREALAALRPHLVLVALGSPKQEQVIAALRPICRRPGWWAWASA